IAVVLLEIGCRQFVLGRKGTVEAGFRHASFPDDLVYADGTDAFAVEQLARHAENLFGGLRRRLITVLHRCFNIFRGCHRRTRLTMLLTGTYVMRPTIDCNVPVSNMNSAVTQSRPFGQRYAFVVVGVIFVSLLIAAGLRSAPAVMMVPLEES